VDGDASGRGSSSTPILMSALHSCSGALLCIVPGIGYAAYGARDLLSVCCATTRMLLESAKRAFLSKGVARLAKRGDRGKLTNIEQHT
jgi:hypothetical protein